jgi:nitrate/TMAO reductase-like tetraheme cytochrome c subunit
VKRLLALARSLSTGWVVAIALVLTAGVVVGGIAGYRTFDYIEHDNEFCLSCHLMQEPFEAFARSAHRGLGCKACHKPSFAGRSQMALTQIIEAPESIENHAEVYNEKCAACHIDGDPEQWETIRNSAGHRVHLESDDPSLEGLLCVECHSSGLHQFTPVTETCTQSGCHSDNTIRLGGMGEFTIHCLACHSYSEPVSEAGEVAAAAAAVEPNAEACLSCHAMRVMVTIPEDEPHGQVCGTCHNPHQQSRPEEAGETCANAGCHEAADTLSPMHRGLEPGALEDCRSCHEAHTWVVSGQTCLRCHTDVFRDEARVGSAPSPASSLQPLHASESPAPPLPSFEPPARVAFLEARWLDGARHVGRSGARPPPAPGREPGLVPGLEPGRAPASSEFSAAGPWGTALQEVPVVPARVDSVFRHAQHRRVECLSCHSTDGSHGRVTVTNMNDCRSCHHTAPVADDCSTCHTASGGEGPVFSLQRDFQFTVKDSVERTLDFDHSVHERMRCALCHTEGPGLSAENVDCAMCHRVHHRPQNVSCLECHTEPAPLSAHPFEQVHVGCSGTGCHTDAPVSQAIRTRNLCLTCHQNQVDHQVGQNCVECHQLPEPVSPGGGGS